MGKPTGSVIGNIEAPKISKVVPKPPESDLPRGLNYYADFSGCGHWRMIWPEILLNGYQKCMVHGLTTMVTDPRFYAGMKTVRVQRQASPMQVEFMKFLKGTQKIHGFNIIYEIDDVLISEDIPNYNKFKSAFEPKEIQDAALTIMNEADEMTVTCQYMKEYYQSKTNNKNITIINNLIPRFWMDGFYNERDTRIRFDRNINKRKRPRVLWAGSGAHFNTARSGSSPDDFDHIINTVIKTKTKYKWIFFGAVPKPLEHLVLSGDIEFHKWVPIYDYPRVKHSLNADIMVAPLQDNPFNNSKSDLKYIEGCAFGIPVVCQDIHTYKNAPYRFTTPEEMVDQIDYITGDKSTYMKISRKARTYADTRWLEDNIHYYEELYKFPYGHANRTEINKLNNI